MQGEVHDPRAYGLGGVAGHAGLFSTAEDLAVYAQALLGRGSYQGVRILKPETVDTMTRGYPVDDVVRGLGWDVLSRYSSNRGDFHSRRAFGHGGFTGTSLWIDPRTGSVCHLSQQSRSSGRKRLHQLIGGTHRNDCCSGDSTAARSAVCTGDRGK